MGGRILRIGLSVIALCLSLVQAAAQEFPLSSSDTASPLLTIEQERLYDETLYGRSLQQALNLEREALIAENQLIFDALSSEEADLARLRAETDAAAFSFLAQEFDTRVQAIRAEQEGKLRALIRKRETDQQAFLNRVLPLVAEVARARGALAVVERRSIFLAVQSIDITEAAIAYIDAQIGDGSQFDAEQEASENPEDGTAGNSETNAPQPDAPDNN